MTSYEILQVANNAEPEVIEAAYRRLSLKYHPDKNNSPDALEKMQQLNTAFEVIGDPERRKEYDLFLIRLEKNEKVLEVAERFLSILSMVTKIPLRKIDLTDKISDDLNFTEETFIQFIELVQEEFFLEFNEEGISILVQSTVGDAIQGIREILSRDSDGNIIVHDSPPAVQPAGKQNEDLFTSFLGIAGSILESANDIFGEVCPHCGKKSWIHQEKKNKSVFDFFTGQQRIKCRNCGGTFVV